MQSETWLYILELPISGRPHCDYFPNRTSGKIPCTGQRICHVQIFYLATIHRHFRLWPAFLSDKFVLSLFYFARFVLDRICATNTKLQEKYMFLHQAWILTKSLRDDFCRYLEELRTRTFSSFEYLRDLSREQLTTFQRIIESFLLNTDNRFPCRSFHLT